MALPRYGVVKGRPVSFDPPARGDRSPHLEVHIDAGGERFRAAVNVKSKQPPSDLVFLQELRFEHPVVARVRAFGPGFTELPRRANAGGLDYIRGNLFDFSTVVALPPERPGLDNDLADMLGAQIQRAIDDPAAELYVFGAPFPQGIHDVHMNQGNAGQFAGDNGVWQDGGVLIHFPGEDRTVALFLAFQSQAIHTDEEGGGPLPGSPLFADVVRGAVAPEPATPEPATPEPIAVGEPHPQPPLPRTDGLVRIVAALVNPEGGEGQPGFAGRPESVTLLNTSPAPVALDGWTILNRAEAAMKVPAGTAIPPGGALLLPMAVPLGNSGGLITLLDGAGMKVDGVSYTADQARREGWTLVF